MSVYAISDTHLSLGTNKSMTVFGDKWFDYVEKLKRNWTDTVKENDYVILPGDISWGMSPEESLEDFKFLCSLPGRKIVGKGNHDYWWNTLTKLNRVFSENNLYSIDFLHNNAYLCDKIIVCGTRGWFIDDDAAPEAGNKILVREANRLSISIGEAKKIKERCPDAEIHVFLHYPPVYGGYVCSEIMGVLIESGIKHCYFGHIHTVAEHKIVRNYSGIKFEVIAADYLNFMPKKIT